MRSKFAVAVVALVGFGVLVALPAVSAGALTSEQCEELVEEGAQARADLQKLIEATADTPGGADTSDPAVATYVAELVQSASINAFGFVSGGAGQDLDLCLPEGTDTLTMFSEPVVLWQGLASSDAFPVTVTIPADTECGEHELRATGDGVDERVTFEVGGDCVTATSALGATTSGGGGGLLPRTGAEIARVVTLALALIALGYSMVRSRRARIAHS